MNTSRPSIEILISTMNRAEPPPVLDGVEPAQGLALLVINQCTTIEPPPAMAEGRRRMISVRERGLSRSRNLALDNASSDIVVIGDDDVSYLPDVASTVERAFAHLPEAAIVTFQYLDADSGRPAKAYGEWASRHDVRSIGSVSSIEIALRPSRLGGLRFDTRFGLGTGLPMGEESIFLADALRVGLPVHYWPAPICAHRGPGTGHSEWTAETARVKGAVMRRMFPLGWPAALAALAYGNLGRVRAVGFGSFMRSAVGGAISAPRARAR
ncbi:MAG: glycosyltransferase family A protein [Myxococcales bacterium]|nr:glycosyltransferase family A protein [Myxococcales bacterium]